jgi:hypothetical protein
MDFNLSLHDQGFTHPGDALPFYLSRFPSGVTFAITNS